MKLPNSIVLDNNFKKSFIKLLKLEFKAPITLKLVKVSKEIDNQTRDVLKVRDELLGRFCIKNGKGVIELKDNLPVFPSKENENSFLKEMLSLLNETFEISLDNKLSLPENSMITAEDVLILEPLLEI